MIFKFAQPTPEDLEVDVCSCSGGGNWKGQGKRDNPLVWHDIDSSIPTIHRPLLSVSKQVRAESSPLIKKLTVKCCMLICLDRFLNLKMHNENDLRLIGHLEVQLPITRDNNETGNVQKTLYLLHKILKIKFHHVSASSVTRLEEMTTERFAFFKALVDVRGLKAKRHLSKRK